MYKLCKESYFLKDRHWLLKGFVKAPPCRSVAQELFSEGSVGLGFTIPTQHMTLAGFKCRTGDFKHNWCNYAHLQLSEHLLSSRCAPWDALTRTEGSCWGDPQVFSCRKHALNNASLTLLIHLKELAVWNSTFLFSLIHLYLCYEKDGSVKCCFMSLLQTSNMTMQEQDLFSVSSRSNSLQRSEVT